MLNNYLKILEGIYDNESESIDSDTFTSELAETIQTLRSIKYLTEEIKKPVDQGIVIRTKEKAQTLVNEYIEKGQSQ